MRTGLGFDVHPFDESRPLVLGGVTIDGAPGLAGHSDADVLCHAVADALLGAAALGDIGTHFPDTDAAWKDASSIDLLKTVREKLAAAGFRPLSVDATVVLERPKIATYVEEMRVNLAAALGVSTEIVSVKATRAEGLGAIGRAEGAACLAIALVG